MKSRTSAALRTRLICEYTILRTDDHVFSYGCDVSFRAVFLTSWACCGRGLYCFRKRASLIPECISSQEPQRHIAMGDEFVNLSVSLLRGAFVVSLWWGASTLDTSGLPRVVIANGLLHSAHCFRVAARVDEFTLHNT